jgi:glycosyltransferase involved in cell wall biosynthesis
MAKPALTVTIISFNEERNIGRAIDSVQWADEILVIDSGSLDRTAEIAIEKGAKVIHNPWPGYGKQKNFAQDSARNDWILNIDADEEVSQELKDELLRTLEDSEKGRTELKAFRLPRKTFYLGRWIKHGGWYPNYLVRFANRKFARWTEPNVHEELKPTNGQAGYFINPLHHYTFASIHDQVLTNLNFSRLGFLELKRKGRKASLAKLLLKPIGKFVETYLLKRGFLDGRPGLIISINAAHSMFLKYAYLIEAEINDAGTDNRQ